MPSSPPSFLSSAASLLVLSARHGTAGHVEPVLVQGDGWGCATEIARLTQDRQSRSAFHRQRVVWRRLRRSHSPWSLRLHGRQGTHAKTGPISKHLNPIRAGSLVAHNVRQGSARGNGGDGENTLPRLSRHRTPEPQTAWKSRGRARGPAVTGVSQARLIAPLPPPPAHGNTLGRGGTSLEPRDDPSCRARC